MSKVEIAPVTRADFLEFLEQEPPVRIRGYCGKVDGRIIGIGGVGTLEDGTRVAFCHLTDEARSYPVALHRIGLKVLRQAREGGARRIIAKAEEGRNRAREWLLRLGFKPMELNGTEVFVYEA